MKLEIYIGRQAGDTYGNEFTRLNLFPDEKVSLTIKNVDISNISKNFSDFTQTFKIPADEVNNAVFKYYYDINNDYQFNANVRVPARIDIDSIPFRVGKVQMELGSMKNGKAEFYSITFYSNLINLKDKFGDDQLTTLGFRQSDGLPTALQAFNFPYTEPEVYDRIMFTDNGSDVVMPVSSVRRYWTFDDNADTGIKYAAGEPNYITKNELRPAINVKRLLEAIEERYDLELGSSFKNGVIANNLFLWLNRNEDVNLTTPIPVDMVNTLVSTYQNPSFPDRNDMMNLNNGFFVIPINRRFGIGADANIGRVEYTITPSAGSRYSAYVVDVNNNVLTSLIDVTGVQTIKAVKVGAYGFTQDTDDFSTKLQLRTDYNSDFTITAEGNYYTIGSLSGTAVYQVAVSSGNTTTIQGNFNIAANLPEMTVSDFFMSLMKMYNLAIIPDDLIENKFNVIPLSEYYAQGVNDIVDLTEFTDNEKYTIGRKKLYQELKFKHADNNMLLNQGFYEALGRRFGDESFKLENSDGGDSVYAVESKFKIMDNTILSIYPVSFAIDTKYEPILNTPVLFAYGGAIESVDSSGTITDDRFGFEYTGGLSIPIQRVPNMANDIIIGDEYLESITFSKEFDFAGNERDRTLYTQYYESYISQIYSLKTREWDFKMFLPSHILYRLKFNTTIIIGDYKYNITEMTVDLTTGQGSVKLLNQLNNGLY